MKKPDDGKPNIKSALLGCGCLMSPIVLLFILLFGAMPYNNFRLWRFERNFAAVPHPASSRFIRREKFIGLIGNSNHCDFLIAELRSDEKTRQVGSFYRSSRVAVPNNADEPAQDTKGGTQPLEIEFLPSPLPPNYHWKFHETLDWNLSGLAGRKGLYVVLILNSGESYSWDSMCDLRCT